MRFTVVLRVIESQKELGGQAWLHPGFLSPFLPEP